MDYLKRNVGVKLINKKYEKILYPFTINNSEF